MLGKSDWEYKVGEINMQNAFKGTVEDSYVISSLIKNASLIRVRIINYNQEDNM